MKPAQRFDGLMRDWLDEQAPQSMPAGLHDRSIAEASYLPQLRPWQIAVRRLARGSSGQLASRVAYVVLVAVLLLALVASLVLGASIISRKPGATKNGAIAYTVGRDAVDGGPNGAAELTSVHLASGGTDLVVSLNGLPSSCAAFSPSGTQLAFWSSDGRAGQQLVIGTAAGGNLRPIAGTSISSYFAPEAAPAWSPDDRQLAYVPWADADGGSMVAVVDVPNGTIRQLSPGLGRIETPRWSHDGLQLAYVAGARNLVVSDADGTAVQTITTADEIELGEWSPDGEWLLYSARSANGTGTDVFITHPDGSGQRKLTADQASNRFAHWSPDSTQVAFITGDTFAASEGFRLDVADIATGSRRTIDPLVTGGGTMWSLIWSPDGQRLGVLSFAEDGYAALANGDGELASIALKTPGDRLVIVPKGEQMWGTCGLSWQRLGD